ncbi:hypothetical protein [Bradyrhizobium centrolobii]|nr:hypothetical protein [Bradyrhizobium centrolobii]
MLAVALIVVWASILWMIATIFVKHTPGWVFYTHDQQQLALVPRR